jgi:ribosomal subunit interface protein
MNIQIDGTNMEVSAEIKALVDDKLSPKLDQLLPMFNNEIKTAFLHLEKDRYDVYHAKFDMALPGKDGSIIATCEHKVLVSTLTGIREQIEKQIKKYKQDQVNYSLG